MKDALLENWYFHRNLAMDILQSLSDEQLHLTVGKHMGTLGEQFRHMARVHIQYTEAIKNGKIGPIQEPFDSKVADSKEALIALWKRTKRDMENVVGSLSAEERENMKIDWRYWHIPEMNLPDHVNALAEHDNLHNGQIIVYLRTHEIPFPDSWKVWGL